MHENFILLHKKYICQKYDFKIFFTFENNVINFTRKKKIAVTSLDNQKKSILPKRKSKPHYKKNYIRRM